MDLTQFKVDDDTIVQGAERAVFAFLTIPGMTPMGTTKAEDPWSIANLPEAGAAVTAAEENAHDIYDIHGNLMFRDYMSPLQNGQSMRVRAAANKLLARPVMSLSVGADLAIDAWMATARAIAAKHGLTPLSDKTALVMHSYPKLGLMCTDGQGRKVVIELAEENPTPIIVGETTGPDLTSWSPLEAAAAQSETNVSDFHANLNNLPEAGGPIGTPGATQTLEAVAANATVKELSGFPLYGQENQVWCAVATGQMILKYHNYDLTQTNIAIAMNTSIIGTTNPDQITGYDTLTNNAYKATLDTTPTFDAAVPSIDAGDPFKSGVPGHARAVAGYKKIAGTTPSNWLQVYDPWPPRQGAIYWENWDSKNHTNYINLVKA